MSTATIHVDFRTTCKLNGEAPEVLAQRIKAAFEAAIDEVVMSDDAMAEIEEYSLDAVINPDNMEDSIADYYAHQLENGCLPLENIHRLIASSGLAATTDFIEEASQQMNAGGEA